MTKPNDDKADARLSNMLQSGCTLAELRAFLQEHGLDPEDAIITISTAYTYVPLEGAEEPVYYGGAYAYE